MTVKVFISIQQSKLIQLMQLHNAKRNESEKSFNKKYDKGSHSAFTCQHQKYL